MGVKPVAPIAREAGLWPGPAAHDVERIAHEGMAGGGQVDPDLVRTAGGDRHLDDRAAVTRPDHTQPGERGPALGRRGMDAPQPWMAHEADGRVDRERRGRDPRDQRPVDLVDPAVAPGSATARRASRARRAGRSPAQPVQRVVSGAIDIPDEAGCG